MNEWMVVAEIGKKDRTKPEFLMCIDCGWKVTAPSYIAVAELRKHKAESGGRCV